MSRGKTRCFFLFIKITTNCLQLISGEFFTSKTLTDPLFYSIVTLNESETPGHKETPKNEKPKKKIDENDP